MEYEYNKACNGDVVCGTGFLLEVVQFGIILGWDTNLAFVSICKLIIHFLRSQKHVIV